MINVLTEGRNLEDINFEIDEIEGCKDCSIEDGVCSLWIRLAFVEDIKLQLNISEAKETIDNLDEQMKVIAMKLISNVETKNEDNI